MADPIAADGDGRAALREMASSARASFQTVEAMTLQFVREAILRGIYRPGQRLQQDVIAEALGVSRMPVRASLRRLEDEGLVVFHTHRGATVRLMGPEEIDEIYQLRILLEQHLLEALAPALDDATLAELEDLAGQVRQQRDTARWVDERRRFYERLYGLAGLPRTVSLILGLRREVEPYLAMRDPGHGHEHVVVLRALREGDVEEAQRQLAAHLSTVSGELQEIVRTLHADMAS